MILRSLLFVPGNNYRAIVKSQKINCDAVIYDLEDAVPIEDKETARVFVNDAVKKMDVKGLKVVRVNSWDTGYTNDDLDWIMHHGLDAVMLPKCESPEDIARLERELEKFEAERNLKRISIIPLIESHKGLLNSYNIAKSSERCIALSFGALDYYRTLGRTYFNFSSEQYELLFARSMIVNSAKAAGLKAIDTPFLGLLVDREGLKRECLLAWQLGFDGKLAIHPNHIEIINEMFTPSEKDVEWAKEVVSVYEDAMAKGAGAVTFKGKMIDYATYTQAKELLEEYEEIRGRTRD